MDKADAIVSKTSTVLLKDGKRIPILGLGMFKVTEGCLQCVLNAFKFGYRHVDTATLYG